MGRIGLALVVLIGLGAVAQADRVACEQPDIKVGKMIVPRGQLQEPGPTIERDSESDDHTPPAAPTDVFISAEANEGFENWININGAFDPDTAYIRLSFDSGSSLITTPDHLGVCSRGVKLDPDTRATLVAYDKAGNASAPFEQRVLITGSAYNHHHDRHGMDVLITVGAIVLACMELVGLVLIGFARKKAPFSVAGEFLSPILAENVARAVARGWLIKLAVAMVIIMGLLGLHHLNIAILVAPFAVAWLFELFLTRLVIGQFDNKIQRLEKRENWIYINSSKLYAPYKIWNAASSLPSAGLAKRD